ncbi:hypothetical protein [Polynucleobacter sp.]|jgi:hypothetical protein|uniref:hypothetical protein n=1 Tax=Polynucleobacter sp. TaxID=2029855 RepID=UPI002583AD3C|nr:hypothetical protein [Polynucleobacter sp.]MCX7238529.1 hypothetical protein [Polynucleobacter sp.]
MTNKQKPRYFLIAVDMKISEGVSKAIIAKSPEDAKRKIQKYLISQNFSEWRYEGQGIESAAEITYIQELTELEYNNYESNS